MQPIAAIERFLERLLERPTARLFHSPLQPIQIQRRIERTMENERRSSGSRTVVPDHYRVHLAPSDVAALGAQASGLAASLADETLAFARSHGYHLEHAPTVELVADHSVPAAEVKVTVVRPAGQDAPSVPAAGAPAQRPGLDETRAYDIPAAPAPAAALREQRPDGAGRWIPIDGSVLTIGRSTDNRLVLDDRRVSRHHARLQARRGLLVLTDLDSANGSRVNGVTISEVALGVGDRIELGTTVFLVEAATHG
jgi:Protein of unknown function (DUF3662)/Inner membrane component of T3SS, cytoplasmic domain